MRTNESCLETRVGYKTLSVLYAQLEDYITAYTVNRRYVGDVHYLLQAQSIGEYLSR